MATRRTQVGLRRRGPGLSRPAGSRRSGFSLAHHTRRVGVGLLLGAALGVAPGCFGLTEDETNRLEVHQASSQEFYNANKLPQALQQADKALELEADHVGMRLIKGFCLMRLGKAFANPAQMDAAIDIFDGLRSGSAGENYRAWLGSGQAHFARALLHEEEAASIERRLSSDFLDDAGRERESEWLVQQLEGQDEHLSKAESALREVLKLDNQEENLWALIELVLVLNTHGQDDEEAASLTRSALEQLAQQDELTERNLNRNASLSSSKAMQLTSRLEENAERERLLRDMLATIEYNRGALQAALEQFEILEDHQLMTGLQHYNRSAVYERLGMFNAAANDLEKYLALRSVDTAYDDTARQVFEQVRELRRRAEQSSPVPLAAPDDDA